MSNLYYDFPIVVQPIPQRLVSFNSILNNYISNMENEYSSMLTEEEELLLEQIVEEAHREVELLPINSDSLSIDESTSRFSSSIWYDNIKSKTATLAGVGGIGSWTALLLSRVKPKYLCLYDFDSVEYANMSGQFFKNSNVGEPKVSAISSLVGDFSSYFDVFSYAEMFTMDTTPSDIMICGFDNMVARRTFFDSWHNHVMLKSEEDRKNCLFIDGRLAAENFQILCIKGDDAYNINRYREEFLFSDEEADATICSYKQTSFCAAMIASYIVNLFVNFCANECNPLIDRDLPFYTEYNAETMFFKTEA